MFGLPNGQQGSRMPSQKRMRTEGGSRPSRTGWLQRKQTRQRGKGRLRSRNALVSVPRGKLAFPQEMRTKLRYVETFDLEPTSQTAAGFSLLANGMYDPEVGVGGHQPRGFDQYTALYQKFTVKSSKISVTFAYEGYNGPAGFLTTGGPSQAIYTTSENNQAAVPSAICLVHKSVETNDTGTIESFQERDRTKWKSICPGGEVKTVSTGLHCSDFFGKDFLVGADGYTGTDSTDPDNKLYYHVMCGLNSNEYPRQINVRANCIVEYDVVWTEPKQLAAS